MLIACNFFCLAQNNLDSLKNSLLKAKDDTDKVKTLNTVSKMYIYQAQYDSALKFAQEVLDLATKLHLEKYEGIANNNIGVIFSILGNYTKAYNYHLSGLKIRERIGDKKGIADSYRNISNIFSDQENYSEALRFAIKSLNARDSSDRQGFASAYTAIGAIYGRQNNTDKALTYHLKSLKINTEINNSSALAVDYSMIGSIYTDRKKYDEALTFCLKALDIREASNEKSFLAPTYSNIGQIFLGQKKYDQAKKYFSKSLAASKTKWELRSYYYFYTKLDSAIGDYKKAFENHKKFILYRDSLKDEENAKKLLQSQISYEFDKRESILKVEHAKEAALAEQESKKQKIIIWSISGMLLLVIGLVFLIYKSYLQKQKSNIALEEKNTLIEEQKRLVEDKQKEIIDSIHYAKRIQTALITPEKYIDKNINRLTK